MATPLPQPSQSLQSLAAQSQMWQPAEPRPPLNGAPYESDKNQFPHPLWMLRMFKVQPCNLDAEAHDHRCCPFYHGTRERRRKVFTDSQSPAYASVPCDFCFDDVGSCPKGEQCDRCHSNTELLYHPDLYKKRFCHQLRSCPRGSFCAFAHSREELLGPHFTQEEESQPTEDFMAQKFKTQWCPVGGAHNWENCVYAHTYRDFRRVPLLGYSSQPCRQWALSTKENSADTDYTVRCPLGFACPMAHGAKEQLYHPKFYKANPCSDPGCRRGVLCAFTHGKSKSSRREQRSRQLRKPIWQAEQILASHQPTFARPPVYQSLEDPKPYEIAKSPKRFGKRKDTRNANSGGRAEEEEAAMKLPGDVSPQFAQYFSQWNQAAVAPIPIITLPTLPSCGSFFSYDSSPSSKTPGDFTPMGQFNENRFNISPQLPWSPGAVQETLDRTKGWRTNSSFGPGTPAQSQPSTPRSPRSPKSPRSLVPSTSTRSGSVSTPFIDAESFGPGSPAASLPLPVALLRP